MQVSDAGRLKALAEENATREHTLVRRSRARPAGHRPAPGHPERGGWR